MHFDNITPAPPDPILGLTEAFKQDSNPLKVNLGVGVYQDDEGKTPVLGCVKAAERAILEAEKSKSYMPIAGDPEYGRLVQDLLFGEGHPALKAGRVRTAHTPGGTGGLRVGAELLRKFSPSATVWVSSPTWANHNGVFAAAGFKVAEYPYYSPATRGLDFDAMCAKLKSLPAGDIVLLHVCCHNPTGVDLTADQWTVVAGIARERGWIPFLDFAYQGFGLGLEADRAGLLAVAEAGVDFVCASSFSKNFGLYAERVGALTVAAKDSKAADAVFSHVKTVIRVIYSNPPAHGSAIVNRILKDGELRGLWEQELKGMCARIAAVRADLVAELKNRGAPMDFGFIVHQHGMFSFSGLSDAQVSFLREKKSIYMVKGGRINVAGITTKNMAYLCDSIVEALRA